MTRKLQQAPVHMQAAGAGAAWKSGSNSVKFKCQQQLGREPKNEAGGPSLFLWLCIFWCRQTCRNIYVYIETCSLPSCLLICSPLYRGQESSLSSYFSSKKTGRRRVMLQGVSVSHSQRNREWWGL